MKKFIFLFAIVIQTQGYAQKNWGVGIRLGDPSGITLKKYFSENALELSFGRTHLFSGQSWYGNRFNDWYNKQNLGHSDFQYVSFKGSLPVSIQLHYLFQKDLNLGSNSVDGLQWYFGFGGQFRFQNYYYTYRYKLQGDPNWYYATSADIPDIDLCADGVLGLEYTFEEVPISLFLDMTLYMELFDNPFQFGFQSGIGGRYNF